MSKPKSAFARTEALPTVGRVAPQLYLPAPAGTWRVALLLTNVSAAPAVRWAAEW